MGAAGSKLGQKLIETVKAKDINQLNAIVEKDKPNKETLTAVLHVV